jgi:hypothetical protein
MIRFIAANGLVVCSIFTTVKQPDVIRSIYCTVRGIREGQFSTLSPNTAIKVRKTTVAAS